MPVIPMQAPASAFNAKTIAASKVFQAWLLDLLEWSVEVSSSNTTGPKRLINGAAREATATQFFEGGAAHAPSIIAMPTTQTKPRPLRKLVARRLHRWHSQVVAQGLQFGALEAPARHVLRKQGKCLRYNLAFAEALLPQTRLRGYCKRLERVQDLLGEINDLTVAKHYYQACTATHPQAWFALGWISARHDELIVLAQHAFEALAQAKSFRKWSPIPGAP
jgi:CHAD domain-containing protein